MAQVLREGVTGAGWLAGSVPTATYAIMSMNNDRSGLMDRVDFLSLLFFFFLFSLPPLERLLGTTGGQRTVFSTTYQRFDAEKKKNAAMAWKKDGIHPFRDC